MKTLLRSVLCGSLCIVLSGCLHVSAKHYTKDKPEGERGFVAYRAVPHLLLTRTGNTEQPVSVQTVYLPDSYERTVFRVRGLFGTAEMGFSLEGDMLKEFNQKQDTKTAETLGSLGALATPFAGLAGTAITTGGALGTEIIKALAALAGTLIAGPQARTAMLTEPDAKTSFTTAFDATVSRLETFAGVLTDAQDRAKAQDILASLKELRPIVELTDYADIDEVLVLRRRISEVAGTFASAFEKRPIFTNGQEEARLSVIDGFAILSRMFDVLITGLQKTIDQPFELYRISVKDGATVLTPVWPVKTACP